MESPKRSARLARLDGRVSVWIVAGLLAAFACASMVCLLEWRGSLLRPRGEERAPAPVAQEAAASEDPEVATSQGPLKLEPGERLVRSVRETAPEGSREDPDARPSTLEGAGCAYSLAVLGEGALWEDLRSTGEEPGLLVVGRTGAKIRQSATERGYFVSHLPIDDLKLSALQAGQGQSRAGFEVLPFAQLPVRKLSGIVDVPDAGEILTLAVARQLARAELPVRLQLRDAAIERLGALEAGPAGLSRDGRLDGILRSAWEKLDLRWELSGSVRFWTIERRGPQGGSVTAYLAVLPAISVTEPAQEGSGEPQARKVYAPPPILEQETVALPGSGDPSQIGREAARRVLDRVVRRLLGAPQLERALVDHAQSHRSAGNGSASG